MTAFEIGRPSSEAVPPHLKGAKTSSSGVPLYRKIFAEVAAKGYEGFELR